MRLEEIIPYLTDNIIVYRACGDDFKNLFNGKAENIPENILAMSIRSIGAQGKSVLDIEITEEKSWTDM